MVSFYPGPSRVYDDVPKYVKAAHRKGILSMNHRSAPFMKLYEKTVTLLQERLDVPSNYKVFFLSSATECWEVIAQSLIETGSHHIFNGAFGEKWYDYTHKLLPSATPHSFDRDEMPDPFKCVYTTGDVICVTQNETSNGTQVVASSIAHIKSLNPNHLVAVDATSSMGGLHLDFNTADVWFASVQKCFGLPAGLAVMICSPAAIEKIKSKAEASHYNSLTLISSMQEKWQTSCTPNVLGIYLLMRTLRDTEHVSKIDARLRTRFHAWESVIGKSSRLQFLIQNEAVRSVTVLALSITEGNVDEFKKLAAQSGFLLGDGYANLRASTLRIANFPAIRKKEVQRLIRFIMKHG